MKNTYWNEYINLDTRVIHFMIKDNGPIKHVINNGFEENPELLKTCNRLCEGDFKSIKELMLSNDFYKKYISSWDTYIQEGAWNDIKNGDKTIQEQVLSGIGAATGDQEYEIPVKCPDNMTHEEEILYKILFDEYQSSINMGNLIERIIWPYCKKERLDQNAYNKLYEYIHHKKIDNVDIDDLSDSFEHYEYLWGFLFPPAMGEIISGSKAYMIFDSDCSYLDNLKDIHRPKGYVQFKIEITLKNNKQFFAQLVSPKTGDVIPWINVDISEFEKYIDEKDMKKQFEKLCTKKIDDAMPADMSRFINSIKRGSNIYKYPAEDFDDGLWIYEKESIVNEFINEFHYLNEVKKLNRYGDWDKKIAVLKKTPVELLIFGESESYGDLHVYYDIKSGEIRESFYGKILAKSWKEFESRLEKTTDTIQESESPSEKFDKVLSVCKDLYKEWSKYDYGIPVGGRIQNVPSASYFDKNYRFLSPEEFKRVGGGVCWDFVEFGAKFLNERGIKYKQLYIITDTPPNYETHTIIVCEVEHRVIYVESSFKKIADELGGVGIFNSIEDVVEYITSVMFEFNGNDERFDKFAYDVIEFTSVPKYGSSCQQYMQWMQDHGEIIYQGIAYPRNKNGDKTIQEGVDENPPVSLSMKFFGKTYKVDVRNSMLDEPIDSEDIETVKHLLENIETTLNKSSASEELENWLADDNYSPMNVSGEDAMEQFIRDSKQPFSTLSPHTIWINKKNGNINSKFMLDCNWTYDEEHGYGFIFKEDLSYFRSGPQMNGYNWEEFEMTKEGYTLTGERSLERFKMFMEANNQQQTQSTDDSDPEELRVDDDDLDTSDLSKFGSDTGSVQNEYDPKEVQKLNMLIASEAAAMGEYLDAAKTTNVDVLRRLYSDIGNEERFHTEQLLFAKASLTGEPYEPRDPEVKKEYEELLAMGMDEETALNTAIDKQGMMGVDDGDDSDIKEIADDMETLEYAISQTYSNIELAEIIMESSDRFKHPELDKAIDTFMESVFVNEAVDNAANDSRSQFSNIVKNNNPITIVINGAMAALRFIHRIVQNIKAFCNKIKVKSKRRQEWLKNHSIKDIFANGVSLYFYDEKNPNRLSDESMRYIELLHEITVACGKHAGIEVMSFDGIVAATGLRLTRTWQPIKFNSIERGCDIVRGVVLSKTKVVITDQNEEMIKRCFFGYNDTTVTPNGNSYNIYNILEYYASVADKFSQVNVEFLKRFKELESDVNSIYYKNRQDYMRLSGYMKTVAKGFNTFVKAFAYDMSTIIKLNDGMLEGTRQKDQEVSGLSS